MLNKGLWRREQGFTLIELMIVILIIAILVAIAVPVYISMENKASRTRAMANSRIASEAFERYYMNEVLAEGFTGMVIPGTSDPINAAYLHTLEPKIKWVDYSLPITINEPVPPSTEYTFDINWPPFSSLTQEEKTGVLLIKLSMGGSSSQTSIVIGTVSKDGHVWFEAYETENDDGSARPGFFDGNGEFEWGTTPP